MSGAALVLVIMLRLKVRPLFLLLTARGSHSAPIAMVGNFPRVITMTTAATSVQPQVDAMAQWTEYVSHVPNLLPAEILILLCLIFGIIFKIACMMYRARRSEIARTRLVLEIGNQSQSISLPAIDLPYSSKITVYI